MLRFAGVALLAVGLSYGRAAAAGDSVAAEALFREGRTAAQNGQWQAACAKFEESERLAPAPGTLLNLGDCKEHLGLLSSAWQHYQEALDRLPNDDDRRAFAEAKIAELSRQLSRLTIRLPPDAPRQTKVFRDGIELGRASLATALPVDPGTHVVEVDAPGHRVSRTEVTVAIGESKDLDAQLGSEVSPAVGADVRDATKGKGGAAPRPSEGSGRLTAGVVVLGVGIASLGVSVASGVLTLEKKNVVNDPSHCVNKTCDDEGVQAASAGKTFSAISTIAFAAAVVGIATGVVLIVSRPASRLRAARAWTQIGVGPGMGLQLRNAFSEFVRLARCNSVLLVVALAFVGATAMLSCAQVIGADFDVQPRSSSSGGGGSSPDCVAVPCVLASGRDYPHQLAVANGYVYWTEDGLDNVGRVMRVSVNGGTPEIVADNQPAPVAVAVRGGYVYWTLFVADGGVRRQAVGGGVVEPVAVHQVAAGVAVDDKAVYWSTLSEIRSAPIGQPTDTGTVLEANLANPSLLTDDGTALYFGEYAQGGRVFRVPKDGSMPLIIAQQQPVPTEVAIVDGYALFTTSVMQGGVSRVPTQGGVVDVIVAGQNQPAGMVTDGIWLYWVNSGSGEIMKVPPGGGTPIVRAVGESPNGVAVDDAFVYWTNFEPQGSIEKIAK